MATQSKKNHLVSGLAVVAIAALAVTFLVSANAAQNSGSTNYSFTGNTPGFIKKATDLGSADPTTVISVTVWLTLHNEAQLDQLVRQQNQKGSPNFHKWITQDSFNAAFSPTAQEVNSVQNYLTAQGLSVVSVAENNFYVMVQGTIGDIEKAFHLSIHNYSWNGQTYRSNTGDPSVNDAAGAHVAAVTGLDDFGFVPNNVAPTDGDGNTIAPLPLP